MGSNSDVNSPMSSDSRTEVDQAIGGWGVWEASDSQHVSRSEILQHTELIETVDQAEDAVDWIWGCKLEGTVVIAVDCEGVHLGKGGYATLIQIATVKKNVFVFDILTCAAIADVIKPLLESSRVVKVLHDCKSDTYALTQLNINLNSVFDTAVAHVVIQMQEDQKKVPIVPSLNKVIELYSGSGGGTNGEKDQMKDVYRHQYDLWAVRPLSDEMLAYAAADVYSLVPEVYKNMKQQVTYEKLMFRMTWESMLCHINKPAVKASKKMRKKRLEADLLTQKLDSAAAPIELDHKELMLLHYIPLTPILKTKIKMTDLAERTIRAIEVGRRNCEDSESKLMSVAEAREEAEAEALKQKKAKTPITWATGPKK